MINYNDPEYRIVSGDRLKKILSLLIPLFVKNKYTNYTEDRIARMLNSGIEWTGDQLSFELSIAQVLVIFEYKTDVQAGTLNLVKCTLLQKKLTANTAGFRELEKLINSVINE